MSLYFAYGSNMSLPRLRARVPSARAARRVVLTGHRLAFHKIGRDGSGKCDIAAAARPSDRVHGVLYRIAPDHRAALDAAEGLGRGYATKTVVLTTPAGGQRTAFTYYATAIDDALAPYSWYLQHVLRGAREHALPAAYIAAIAAVAAVADPDRRRSRPELAIYR